MRIEGRGLEHLSEGELHLVGERCEVGRRNLVPSVLDEVQIFDQQVAPPRPVAQQKRNLFSRLWIDLAALGGRFGPLSAFAQMFERADFLHVLDYPSFSV